MSETLYNVILEFLAIGAGIFTSLVFLILAYMAKDGDGKFVCYASFMIIFIFSILLLGLTLKYSVKSLLLENGYLVKVQKE